MNKKIISEFIRFGTSGCTLIAGVSYSNLEDAKENCEIRDDCSGVYNTICPAVIPNSMAFGLCDKNVAMFDAFSLPCLGGADDNLVFHRLQLSGTKLIFFCETNKALFGNQLVFVH